MGGVVKRDTSKGLPSSGGTIELPASKPKTSPKPMSRCRSVATVTTATQKLRPIDRKKLLEFVQQSWKEVQMLKRATSPQHPGRERLREEQQKRLASLKARARESLERVNSSKYLGPRKSIERLLSTDRECNTSAR